MTYFEQSSNKIFFGSTDKLIDWQAENLDQGKIVEKIRLLLKNYLELDNVSFLFGSGTSIHLGVVSIRNFPVEVKKHIYEKDSKVHGVKEEFVNTIKVLQSDLLKYGKVNLIGTSNEFEDSRKWKFIIAEEIVRDITSNEIAMEYEKVLNFLIAKDDALGEDKSAGRKDKISELILTIKEGLFKLCDLKHRDVSKAIINRKKASKFEK